VLSGRLDQQFAFARIVTARFLDVDVLAGSTRRDRGGCVPVIRCGDGQRVDGPVFKDTAKILYLLWIFVLDGLDGSRGLLVPIIATTTLLLGASTPRIAAKPGATPNPTPTPAVVSRNLRLVMLDFITTSHSLVQRLCIDF
jgi:hypothetical protein